MEAFYMFDNMTTVCNNKQINLKEVNVGDLVLADKDKWDVVVDINEIFVNGIIEIVLFDKGIIQVHPEANLFIVKIIDNHYSDIELKKAKDVKSNDILVGINFNRGKDNVIYHYEHVLFSRKLEIPAYLYILETKNLKTYLLNGVFVQNNF